MARHGDTEGISPPRQFPLMVQWVGGGVVRVYGPRLTLISHFMTLSFTPVRHLSSTRPHHPLQLHRQTLFIYSFIEYLPPSLRTFIFYQYFSITSLFDNFIPISNLTSFTHEFNAFSVFLPLPQLFVENCVRSNHFSTVISFENIFRYLLYLAFVLLELRYLCVSVFNSLPQK